MSGETLNATLAGAAVYDEMFGADGECRPHYRALYRRLTKSRPRS